MPVCAADARHSVGAAGNTISPDRIAIDYCRFVTIRCIRVKTGPGCGAAAGLIAVLLWPLVPYASPSIVG